MALDIVVPPTSAAWICRTAWTIWAEEQWWKSFAPTLTSYATTPSSPRNWEQQIDAPAALTSGQWGQIGLGLAVISLWGGGEITDACLPVVLGKSAFEE